MKISVAGLQLLCLITLFVLTWLKLWLNLSPAKNAQELQLQIEEPPHLTLSFSIGVIGSELSKSFDAHQYTNFEIAIKGTTLDYKYKLDRPRVARSRDAIPIREGIYLSSEVQLMRNKEAEKQPEVVVCTCF